MWPFDSSSGSDKPPRADKPLPALGKPPFFAPFLKKRPLLHEISLAQGPTFVRDLIDQKANSAGIRGADLGIPLINGSKMWLLFGDTQRTIPGTGGSSSVLESGVPYNPEGASWKTDGGGFYEPIKSDREEGKDCSTVPCGAICVEGTPYIFAKRIEHWGFKGGGPTRGHGVLFKKMDEFSEIAKWGTDGLHFETVPLAGKLPDGSDAIFMFLTGKYRQSAIYLAYVKPSDIEIPLRYSYFTGYGADGAPMWAQDITKAKPLPDFADVLAGELSAIYYSPFDAYLLMFKDYDEKVFKLYAADKPYGPFSGVARFRPCGSPQSRPSWMRPEWGGCYGGYMLPETFGDGKDLYFTVSIWKPYTTMLMKMRLNSRQRAETGSGQEDRADPGAPPV